MDTSMKAFAISLIIAASVAVVHADSLYPLDNAKNAATTFSFFNDSRARKVGDPVMVLIGETATGTVTSTAKADTSSTGNGVALGPSASIAHSFGLNGVTNSASNGTTTRDDSLNASIEVRVTAVYSNGTMKIEGTKTVLNNGEEEDVKLSGLIRQQDINPDNTISSRLIANASITYGGRGMKHRRLLFGFIPM